MDQTYDSRLDMVQCISHCYVASRLWKDIKNVRFSVKNRQKVQRLNVELATYRQNGMEVEAYYGKLTQLWHSMKDYQYAKTMADVKNNMKKIRCINSLWVLMTLCVAL